MDLAGEAAKEEGGGTASVTNVLPDGGPVSITLWVIELRILGGDVLESGGSACGLPKADNGAEGKAA